MNRLAVIGHPVAHSLSPAMHTAAFAALGIGDEWTYEAIDLEPERFADGIDELRERGFVGVNVTVPHKRAAFEIADERSDAVAAIGAANTLTFAGRLDPRRQHRRQRADRRAARTASTRPAPRRSCSAPAARRGPSPGRSTAPARR